MKKSFVIVLAIAALAASPAIAKPHGASSNSGSNADAGGSGTNVAAGAVKLHSKSEATYTNAKSHSKGFAHGFADGTTETFAITKAKAIANLKADGAPHAKAVAITKGEASVGAGIGLISKHKLVIASATGGAIPSAYTSARVNPHDHTFAKAVAGKTATAKGGTVTIEHLGHHVTVAIAYTLDAYSVAVSRPHSVTAYSGIAHAGSSFYGPNIIAAAQEAAFAFATAGQDFAAAGARASEATYAQNGGASSYANSGSYADATIYAYAGTDPKNESAVVIALAGGTSEKCWWRQDKQRLYCAPIEH